MVTEKKNTSVKMYKIREIIIGTNNTGKYKEICNLLPKIVKKYSPKKFKIKEPKETGKSFKENSIIKASYYSKKTNLICLSDDSGLEIDVLNKAPGIHSARWAGKRNNFDLKSNDPNPEKIMIKKQRIAILRQIVDQLKPKYRDLVKLRYFKELSYEEIAETLEVPLGTVKAQLHRSREQLFKIMSGTRDLI